MTPTQIDDAGAVAGVLATVRPLFPPFVHDAVFHLRADHSGDPAVWIWLVLDDDTDVEASDVQDELTRVRRAIFDRVLDSGIDRWPYIYVRTDSEQREHLVRGKA